MNISDLIKRVDQLIESGNAVLATRYGIAEVPPLVDFGKFRGFRAGVLSFVERVYGSQHSHYKEFSQYVSGSSPSCVEQGIAILETIKGEISGGWLFSIKGLVTAEIFSDFLEMAQYLLDQDYDTPAAVMAGSVLEEHLRQLCIKNGIEVETELNGRTVPKKADRMNADLAKKEVYNKLDQKAVTTWLDLRNSAAHGKYEEYNKEQVRLMLQGINEFLVRVGI